MGPHPVLLLGAGCQADDARRLGVSHTLRRSRPFDPHAAGAAHHRLVGHRDLLREQTVPVPRERGGQNHPDRHIFPQVRRPDPVPPARAQPGRDGRRAGDRGGVLPEGGRPHQCLVRRSCQRTRRHPAGLQHGPGTGNVKQHVPYVLCQFRRIHGSCTHFYPLRSSTGGTSTAGRSSAWTT